MKNDLDFLKDKIENSGVKAPEDMDEAYVAKTLEGVTPRPISLDPPKKKHTAAVIAISSVAAVLVLTLTLGIVLRFTLGKNSLQTLDFPGGLTLKRFTDYAQVEKEIGEIKSRQNSGGVFDYFSGDFSAKNYAAGDVMDDAEMAADGSFANGSSGNTNSGNIAADLSELSHSETYEQVEGVSEADIIKTDGRYIYCVDSGYSYDNKVVIFTANGKDSEKVAEIDIFDEDEATRDESDPWDYYYTKSRSICDMYLKDDRLIVICESWSGHDGYSVDMSQAMIYDVGDIEHISLVDTFTQSGHCDASRMIGDDLYLISSYVPYESYSIPECGRGDDPDTIPADCIYAPLDADSQRFLVISAIDTVDHTTQTESKSILGAVDDIYCNLDHLYIYSTHHDESWYNSFRVFDDTDYDAVTTQIIKVDLADGIAFSAYGEVNGYVDDQYALDEYEGLLRIATTVPGEHDSNNLYVLDDELSIIGSVTGFSENEQIKAVRYVGDTAYVITYEQTDPLFVIDLSNPIAPTILGEAKISGFSTMLVPIDDNTILGLGYHTENTSYSDMEVQDGVKIALFDVSDKLNPKVLDTLVYENCNSEVQYNPKALVYNPDRGDYIIPLNYANWGTVDFDAEAYWADEEYYGGVLNFKAEDGKLTEIGRYKADYDEVERCAYVGDNIYMTYRDSDNDYKLNIDSVPYKK